MENTNIKNINLNRFVYLDFLRGVAILLVLLTHLPLDFSQKIYHNSIYSLLRIISQFGWVGVDLFFVISGFIVSNILFTEYKKNNIIRFKRFMMRRILRIFPPFYGCIIISFIIIGAITNFNLKLIKSVLINFCYLQNYAYSNFIPHTWSLAVEEHFYIILPIILFVYLKFNNSLNKFDNLWIGIIVIVVIIRIINAKINPLFNEFVGFCYPTHLRFDSIAFGVLLSYYYNFNYSFFASLFQKKILLICSCTILVILSFIDFTAFIFLKIFGFTLLYLAFGTILSYIMCLPNMSNNFFINVVSKIGKYSYSIYLYHYLSLFFFYPISHNINMEIFLRVFLYCLYTLILSYTAVRFIEIPALKLQNKLVP